MQNSLTDTRKSRQRPELTAIEETIKHAEKKHKRAEDAYAEVMKEKKSKEDKIPSLKKELEAVEMELKALQKKQKKESEATGFSLDEEDIKEYTKLYVPAASRFLTRAFRATRYRLAILTFIRLVTNSFPFCLPLGRLQESTK